MSLNDFHRYTAWHDHVNQQVYDAPPDPWALVSVDPQKIDEFNVVPVKWGLNRIVGGDWDDSENLTSMSTTPIYRGLKQRFEEGLDWQETDYYEMGKYRIEQEGEFRGCTDVCRLIEERCVDVDEIFDSIRRDGYRPNVGNLYESPRDAAGIHELEPMVLIGRTGDVYCTEGFHRLTLAKLLDLTTLPVYVVQRHELWQQTRDQVQNAEVKGLTNCDVSADHPDLQDVTT
jgi:hypothetical protein